MKENTNYCNFCGCVIKKGSGTFYYKRLVHKFRCKSALKKLEQKGKK